MFKFVTVSHPDEIKDRKKQGKLRQHAIRNGIQRSKADKAKRDGIFVSVQIDANTGQTVKRLLPKVDNLTNTPSISLLDPFNTLCECPERLRKLMRHPSAKQAGEPIFCVEDSGKPFFQGMETIFRSALTDPSLFHALSLVLSLAANNNLPNIEVLTHRGELLNGIRVNIKSLDGAPQVSTLTAMLLLIGYEYRMDGASCTTIAAHIRGVQAMMKLCKARNVALVDEVQRALFWQDLLSCLMAGTSRFLSHKDFQDFASPKDVDQSEQRKVPLGLRSNVIQWPEEFAHVLQDLNSLCWLVDLQCGPNKAPIDVFPVDNNQANLESRLVDLLYQCRNSIHNTDPWYEACVLAAYICTYKLSTGIWMGCYIPEFCINHIVRLVTQVPRSPQWLPSPSLLMWLLFVSGGMTDRKELRTPIAELIRKLFPNNSEDLGQEWELLRVSLKTFIWCEHSMGQKVFMFWKEVYPRTTGMNDLGTVSWRDNETADFQI